MAFIRHYGLWMILAAVLFVFIVHLGFKIRTLDSWLNVALLAAIPLLMGWAGIYLAAKVLPTSGDKWIVAFSLLLLLGLGLTIVQQGRSERALAEEKQSAAEDRKDLNGKIENLAAQVRALLPSALASGDTDELRAMHTEMSARFDRIEKAMGSLGGKTSVPEQNAVPAPVVPAVVQHIQISQKQVPSTSEETPYALQVIIQTDIEQQPTAFMLQADGDIADGKFFMAGQGAMMGVAWGVQPDKRHFYLKVNFPPFAPESPIVVTLLSKTAIRVIKVDRSR